MPPADRTLSTKGRERRRQIIDAAGHLFAQRGYAAVSLRDIAGEAGITHPLLSHYFRDKEDLLHAVIDSWRERASRHELLGETEREGWPDRVVALAEENAQVPDYIALFSGLAADAVDPDHPAHERFAKQYSEVYDSLLGFFGWAQEHGRLRAGVDPATAALSVIALEDGAQVQWLYRPDEVDIPAIVRSYLDLVLTGD